MSKSLKIFLLVVFIIILGIALFFYVGFAGLPWKKFMVGNETLEYLEAKYNEEFKIEDRFFNFKDGTYNISVHPVKDPTLTFHAGEGWGNHKFVDYYAEEVWTKQAEADYKEIVHEVFPDLRRFHVSTVYGEGIEKVKQPPIPNYIESNVYMDVAVMLPYKFNGTNEEFERMLTLIKFVQERGGNISIFMAYEPSEEDGKNATFVNFSNKEIMEIQTAEDVKKYYNNLE